MGRFWWSRMVVKVYCTDIHTGQERPVCGVCLAAFCAKTGNKAAHGKTYFGKDCRGCRNERVHSRRHTDTKTEKGRLGVRWRLNKHRRPYIVHRKTYCEECGFIPQHMAQLEVDHVDGRKINNDPANLRTLCANCHRLKTMTNGDHYGKRYIRANTRRAG